MLPALLLALAASPCAMAEPPAFALLPFGVDLYIQKKPVRAILYTLTQGLGVAAAAYGTARVDAYVVEEDDEASKPWRIVTAAGVTMAGASYVTSLVDASNLHSKESVASSAAWIPDWDRRRQAVHPTLAADPRQVDTARADPLHAAD